MTASGVSLVVDAGGSRVRVHAYQGDQVIDSYEVIRSGNPHRVGIDRSQQAIEDAVDGLIARGRVRSFQRLACGIAGAARPMIRGALTDSLSRRYFCDVFVCSDADSLLAAAVDDGPVSVLIAGTGSIAMARRKDGLVDRAGGVGAPEGDPGSGGWLAARAREILGNDVSAELDDYQIGPRVEALALSGNQKAVSLLESCAASLVRLLCSLEPDPGVLVVEGGLIANSSVVRQSFQRRLGDDLPCLTPADPWRPAHWGALRLALDAGGLEGQGWL